MDAARVVVERLARIDALERQGAAPLEILAELRLLVVEAEEWTRVEGDARARLAAARLRDTLAHEMIPM